MNRGKKHNDNPSTFAAGRARVGELEQHIYQHWELGEVYPHGATDDAIGQAIQLSYPLGEVPKRNDLVKGHIQPILPKCDLELVHPDAKLDQLKHFQQNRERPVVILRPNSMEGGLTAFWVDDDELKAEEKIKQKRFTQEKIDLAIRKTKSSELFVFPTTPPAETVETKEKPTRVIIDFDHTEFVEYILIECGLMQQPKNPTLEFLSLAFTLYLSGPQAGVTEKLTLAATKARTTSVMALAAEAAAKATNPSMTVVRTAQARREEADEAAAELKQMQGTCAQVSRGWERLMLGIAGVIKFGSVLVTTPIVLANSRYRAHHREMRYFSDPEKQWGKSKDNAYSRRIHGMIREHGVEGTIAIGKSMLPRDLIFDGVMKQLLDEPVALVMYSSNILAAVLELATFKDFPAILTKLFFNGIRLTPEIATSFIFYTHEHWAHALSTLPADIYQYIVDGIDVPGLGPLVAAVTLAIATFYALGGYALGAQGFRNIESRIELPIIKALVECFRPSKEKKPRVEIFSRGRGDESSPPQKPKSATTSSVELGSIRIIPAENKDNPDADGDAKITRSPTVSGRIVVAVTPPSQTEDTELNRTWESNPLQLSEDDDKHHSSEAKLAVLTIEDATPKPENEPVLEAEADPSAAASTRASQSRRSFGAGLFNDASPTPAAPPMPPQTGVTVSFGLGS